MCQLCQSLLYSSTMKPQQQNMIFNKACWGGPCFRKAVWLSLSMTTPPQVPTHSSRQAFMFPGLFFFDLNYWSLPASVLTLASHEDFTRWALPYLAQGCHGWLDLLLRPGSWPLPQSASLGHNTSTPRLSGMDPCHGPRASLEQKWSNLKLLRLSFQHNPLDFILCSLPKETAWNLLAYILPLSP